MLISLRPGVQHIIDRSMIDINKAFFLFRFRADSDRRSSKRDTWCATVASESNLYSLGLVARGDLLAQVAILVLHVFQPCCGSQRLSLAVSLATKQAQ